MAISPSCATTSTTSRTAKSRMLWTSSQAHTASTKVGAGCCTLTSRLQLLFGLSPVQVLKAILAVTWT